MIKSLFLLLLLGALDAHAETRLVALKSGDRITIQENVKTIVSCEGTPDQSSAVCHPLQSDAACRGVTLGFACNGKDAKIGSCVSNELLEGAPNCRCK